MTKAEEEQEPKFHMGDVLIAPAYGNLDKEFTGLVEKVYENSLLVEIIENDPADQPAVNEMNHRAIVRMDEVKVTHKADLPDDEEE